MARTSSSSVQGVLLQDYDSNRSPDLSPFIDTANAIVTRAAACATARGITLSDSELELIERWLAAHCYKMSDQAVASRNTGKAGGSFQGQTAMYFESTKYGQTAVGLDYSGCLTALNKPRAQAFWLGKPESDQIDYEDRN